jgi:hypothetical protein
LKSGQQRRYKVADGYMKALEKKCEELLNKLSYKEKGLAASKINLGGARQQTAASKDAITQVKRSRLETWMVTGKIHDSKKTKGVRANIYELASEEGGACAVPPVGVRDIQSVDSHRHAIYYDEKDLVFNLIFFEMGAAVRFWNRVLNMKSVNPDKIDINQPVKSRTEQVNFIHTRDYNSDDEESPKYSVAVSSVRTEVDTRSDLAIYQSLELEHFLRADLGVQSCHLVHKSHVEDVGIEDNDNNRICLTPMLHRMFDGHRNKTGYTRPPRIMFEPSEEPAFQSAKSGETLNQRKGLIERDTLQRQRHKVWIKVSCLEREDYETICHFLKVGTVVDPNNDDHGIPICYSFVHVLSPKTFKENLRWKAENETIPEWEKFREERME